MLLLLLINRLHLSLASALIEHPLFGMAWFCIPYSGGKDALHKKANIKKK